MRLPPANIGLRRQLIELLDIQTLGRAAVSGGLPLAQLFENADLAIGFDKGQAAALGLGLNLGDLRSQRSALSRQRQLETVSLQESIDVGSTGRLEAARFLSSRGLLLRERLVFRT